MAAASMLLRLSTSLLSLNIRRLACRPISPSPILPSPHQSRRGLIHFNLPVAYSLTSGSSLSVHRCHCTSSAGALAVDASPASSEEPPSFASHPWPEWEQFLDKLRAKGYFEASTSAITAADGESEGTSASLNVEVNRVKNACLKFARERFDIFSSLPREDIVTVVKCGCPNVFRKAVNSAKRLRAYLQLDEGDVCSTCNLRGSCDKAYIIPNEQEGPRTVDVVRILLNYAVNPNNLAGGESSPVVRDVQKSARNLLSELIKLSDTAIDPSIPKPVVIPPSPQEPSQDVSRKSSGASNIEMKRGDWLCPNCNFLNFARNLSCLECKQEGPKRVNLGTTEMKLGDWNCPRCKFMNFARNRKCFRCQEQRPKRELFNGEWECPSCYYLNFNRNKVCKKCDCQRPEGEADRLDDHAWRSHAWRSPGQSTKNTRKFKDNDDDEDDEDDDDDILPLSGEYKFTTRRRATPAERRLTSARKPSYE